MQLKDLKDFEYILKERRRIEKIAFLYRYLSLIMPLITILIYVYTTLCSIALCYLEFHV